MTDARAGPNWAVIALVVAAGAFTIAGVSYVQQARALADVRESQRRLAMELASLQRAPRIDLAGVPQLGADAAIVTLVEFSDYQCPFCLRHFQQTMPRIVDEYITPGRLRYAFRDWPVAELHPQAIRAHEAAHCAGEQGKYWELHRRLFAPAGTHTADHLLSLAREIGLDIGAFTSCTGADRTAAAIRASIDQAAAFGATGTPSFFLGLRDPATDLVAVRRAISGAQPFEVFAKTIDDLLEEAAAGGRPGTR